ncbi:dpy-30 motif family protein [Chrysochromulina tobinii]|uniref:Dpy-30 motif family protein n=1 Tax=Chrysochromulina tobinii TaxID=1460289 RepID=A0A0M0K9A9_9EUKA|nr:dpy-30 motif family protein [Chrysochromulina tobinii]|eukprot:KOO35415.1 dpy-30 motif family protein [Chrysochromulina sp. CCMP291]
MSDREYLAANGVQEALAAAVLEVLQTRPAQPLLAICKFLASKEAAQEGQAAAAASAAAGGGGAAVSHAERFLQLFQPKPLPRPRARAAIVDAVTEATLDALFDAIDTDHSGTLDANELLAILLKMGFSGLDEEACNALIREVDLNGDSLVQREEFAALVTPTAPLDGARPHLVLHFDVNMTVIMLDSAIGGDSAKILNMVLSNCVWGKVTPAEPEPTWELVSEIPSPTAPEIGLQTYAEYVMSVTDVKGMSDVTKIRETKARRRKALQNFTSAGAPGAALAALLRSMADALKLPKQLISDEQADELKRLGLDGGVCVLLPSFLHLLRELKKTGRSFSICFRTYNALCEGTHPLFPGRDVVLDGSDGGPDMRIDMGQVDKCGTFVRDGAGKIALVLGTIEQPDRAQASSYDEIAKFYAAYDPPVRVMPAIEAANTLDFLLGPAAPRTLALRDYYSGWEAVGCQAHGGKPLLLKSSPTELQIFFDDHITSHDAHIIDCRRAADPDAEPLPIAATLGIHLVKAEPVLSISQSSYFVDCIAEAEKKWRIQAARRATLAEALRTCTIDLKGWALVKAAISATVAAPGVAPAYKYVPHTATEAVLKSSTYKADHDDMVLLDSC